MELAPIPVTAGEIDYSIELLTQTRGRLAAAVSGTSEKQWRFKPEIDCWSMSEVVEHVALVEEAILTRVVPALESGPPPARDLKTLDSSLVTQIVDRNVRFSAPERFFPTGRLSQAEAIRRFESIRDKFIELARNPAGFREHTVNHVLFGPLDGYQWILAVAMHSARHAAQIEEIKLHPGYPIPTDATSTAVAADSA